MIQAPHILDAQLDILEERANPERWRPALRSALERADVDDYVALALETLDRIRQLARRTVAPERAWVYYQRWHGIALRVLAHVDGLEAAGEAVEQSDTFRFAINEAAIAVDHERVAAAQQRLAAGHGLKVEEIENARQAG